MKFYFLIHKCTRTPTDTLAPEALSHTVAHEELLKMMEIFLMHENPRKTQEREFAATCSRPRPSGRASLSCAEGTTLTAFWAVP